MIMGSVHTPKNEILNDVKNILIIQLGDIGDVVWTIPTLRAVRERCPDARLSVLLRGGSGNLLQKEPFIYKIFEVKHHGGNIYFDVLGQVRLIKDLRREHFDLVVDMRADDRGAIMSYMTGAPIRVSQFYANVPFWRNRLFTHLFNSPGKKVRGASEQSLHIVRELGIDTVDITPRLCASETRMVRAREILLFQGISDTTRFISLNPFSRWSYKEWDYDKWVQIINWLWNNYSTATVIVGTDEERTRAETMLRKCAGPVFNLAGKTRLGELAGILHLSSLHIGVDSAAPHIAAAVGTPTITIYGPSDWYDWAPVGDMHKVVLPDLACVPCHKKGCDDGGWSRCLEELTVDQVKKVVQEFLEGTFPSSVGLRKE